MSENPAKNLGWTNRLLTDVAQIIDPHPSHRAPDAVVDGVPFAGIGDLTERGELLNGQARLVPRVVLTEHGARYRLSRNSIGFGRVASIGKVIDFRQDVPDLTISPTMAVIEPFGIDRGFLLHSLRSVAVKEAIDRWLTGSTRSSLGIELLRQIPISAPAASVQKKIAAILTSIDTAIEKTEALIAKYQQIKAGLMHDLFTRGVLPNGQLRPPREQAPDLYQETVIGWLPKDWRITTLGAMLSRIDAGWSPDCLEFPPASGEWGVLKVSAVTRGFYTPTESKALPPSMVSDPSIEVKNGDVILTRANGVAELVGLTVQVRNTPPRLMLSDKLLRLIPLEDVLHKGFLASLMQANVIKSQIESVMSGSSGQRNIGQTQIRSFCFGCPPLAEQADIDKVLQVAALSLESERVKQLKYQHQKLGLMQDLLTGKVPVQVHEPAAESAHA
ncbi:MAG: restriction endonuclease subunit S [Ramlibacter sp.]